MERSKIIKIVDKVFKSEFEKRAKIVCNPLYYKNVFLQYAMEHHKSTQCIVRTYLEMLKASSTLIKRPFDMWEINQSLIYINTFQNRSILDFIDQKMSELNNNSPLPKYIIKNNSDRFKSVRSHLAKLRTSEVTEETLLFMKNNLSILPEFKDFSKSDIAIAKKYLQQLWDDNYQKSPTKDLIGYREIYYACDNTTEDTIIIPYVYKSVNSLKEFCKENGFGITKEKDYIHSPKPTGYRSYHITIDILGAKVEVQSRTGEMNEDAIYGTSAYDSVYKNTMIQHFFSDYMYEISKKLKRITMYEDIGVLKEVSLSNMPICKTPNSEVPKTPAQLIPFTDITLIEATISISPKFSDLS